MELSKILTTLLEVMAKLTTLPKLSSYPTNNKFDIKINYEQKNLNISINTQKSYIGSFYTYNNSIRIWIGFYEKIEKFCISILSKDGNIKNRKFYYLAEHIPCDNDYWYTISLTEQSDSEKIFEEIKSIIEEI